MCLKFVQNGFLTDSVLRNEEFKQSEVVLMHI